MARVSASASPAWLWRPSLVAPGPEGCSDAIQGDEDDAHPWILSSSNSRTRSTRPWIQEVGVGEPEMQSLSNSPTHQLDAVRGVRLLSRDDAQPWGGNNPSVLLQLSCR